MSEWTLCSNDSAPGSDSGSFFCNGKGGMDSMCKNRYEKMIAVTNRHLVMGNDAGGDVDVTLNAGAEWSAAYLKQLAYVASLHPKAMVLREKDLTEEKYEELAKTVIRLCEQAGTTLILHRFPEVVQHLGYDKLHLPLEMLKNTGQPEGLTLLGTSIHSVEDAKEAEQLGADYVFAGNIFETDCKKGLSGRGLEFLETVCKAVNIPVYAIGGITEEKMPQILGTGAVGGCMMSGFMQLKDKQ